MRSWPFWSDSKTFEVCLLFCHAADSVLLTLSRQWHKAATEELTDSMNTQVQTNVPATHPTRPHLPLTTKHPSTQLLDSGAAEPFSRQSCTGISHATSCTFQKLVPLRIKAQPLQQEQKQVLNIKDALLCFPVWKELMRAGSPEPSSATKWDQNGEAISRSTAKSGHGQGGVFEGALFSPLLNGFLLYIVMQISAWGGEMSKLAVEYLLCAVSALFPWTLSVPALSITALDSQKNEILSVSQPNSSASTYSWIKQLHSLQLAILGLPFLEPYSRIYGLRANRLLQPIMNLSSEVKTSDTESTWTLAQNSRFHVKLSPPSASGAPAHNVRVIRSRQLFVSHWSGSTGFRLFYFVLSF